LAAVTLTTKYDTLSLHEALPIYYRKDKINVERQLDALNVLEKEEYQCSFNLKRIISGVEAPTVSIISKTIHMFNKELDFSQITADRKSTRLNSSHVSISYAVFCL